MIMKIKLNYRIMIITFITGLMLSLFVVISVYFIMKTSLFNALKHRIVNITALSAQKIDKELLEHLVNLSKLNNSDEDIKIIENSEEYKKIGDQVVEIHEIEKEFFQYIYIMTPTEEIGKAKIILDDETYIYLQKPDMKTAMEEEDIVHFSDFYDLTSFPIMQKAINEKINIVEDKVYWDAETGIYSISGYAPIFSKDGSRFLGIIGMDVSSNYVNEILNVTVNILVILCLAAVLTAVAVSFFISNHISKPILNLNLSVNELINSNFKNVLPVENLPDNELGELGRNFNFMAEKLIFGNSLNEEKNSLLYMLTTAYQRFVPRQFLNLINKKNITDVKIGDHIERDMTILFSDIRNFTTFSEKLTPQENFKFLNSYLNQMTPIIHESGGFVDKYIGDAIMALFPGKAEDGLKAAIYMQKHMDVYNFIRSRYNYKPLSIGIGLHTGNVMLGTVGDENRMEGTVISDAVNISSRLENLTKIFGTYILASQEILLNIQDPTIYTFRFLGKIQVKGKRQWVGVFEFFDGYSDDVKKIKLSTKYNFEKGLNAYLEKNFSEALKFFDEVLKVDPDDKPAMYYKKDITKCLSTCIDDSWDAVLIIED